jgi:sugar-phosphatase
LIPAQPIRALIFDLDGTLVDTETQTAQAIAAVVAGHGVANFSLPIVETHGRTWDDVARRIKALTELGVSERMLVSELLGAWNKLTLHALPVPGAVEALRLAAQEGLRISVVSSSPHVVIDAFVQRLGVAELIAPQARIGGDEVNRGKPDPEGFLRAAQRLDATPATSLVFEDSRAGLTAARAAGMRSIYVTCCAGVDAANLALATASCTDYRALPGTFWRRLLTGYEDLDGKCFA